MEETKKCPRCGRELPKSEFFGGYCKECKRAMNREYTQRKAKMRREAIRNLLSLRHVSSWKSCVSEDTEVN